MKQKILAFVAILAIVCSLSAVFVPAPTQAAPCAGSTDCGTTTDPLQATWINRFQISYNNQIFTDVNPYDTNYNFVAGNQLDNQCQATELQFSWLDRTSNTTIEPGALLWPTNIAFYYDDDLYNNGVLFGTVYSTVVVFTTYSLQGNGGGVCSPTHQNPSSKPIHPERRKVVLVYNDAHTQIMSVLNTSAVLFEKDTTTLGGHAIFIAPENGEKCRDAIVDVPGNTNPNDYPFDQDPVPGDPANGVYSVTLYAVQDSASDGHHAESYNNVRGLSGSATLDCQIGVIDDKYPDISQGAIYPFATRDDTPLFEANGIKSDGSYYTRGNEKDDAFLAFVGEIADSGSRNGDGSAGDTPVPPPANAPDDTSCKTIDGALGWLFCGFVDAIVKGLTSVDAFITGQMKIDTETIFDSASTTSFRKSWGIFRNIAYALLIIIGLIMVVSQVMGLEIFDAYAIRKMLPRLALAAIALPLLWPLLRILLEFSNDAADAAYAIILGPFGYGDGLTLTQLIGWTSGGGIVGLFAVGGAAGYLAIGGLGVALAMVGSALISILSALFVLLARDAIVYALIILSPVAVVCATFAPFKKIFDTWRTYLVTIMMAVPATAGVLAASKVAAEISFHADPTWGLLLAIVFLVVGYAMFWKVFQQMDKLSGQLGSMVGKATSGAQKALGEYRKNSRKQRLNEAVEGRRKFGGGPLGWAGNRAAGLVRRGRLSGQVGAGAFGIGRNGRAAYKEAARTMMAGAAAKMVEQDKNRAGGDDDAMRLLARRGMTGKRFLREYADLQQRRDPTLDRDTAEQRARAALGLSESSLGAKAGTSAMRIAAQSAALKSNTSYRTQMQYNEQTGEWEVPKKYNEKTGKWEEQWMDFDTMSRTMYGDVAELVNDGLITAADGAAMIKSNGARADRAAGFGATLGQLQVAATKGTKAMDTSVLLDDILSGNGAGQMAGQRHEGIRILAPEMLKRAQDAAARDKKTITRVDADGKTVEVKQRQLGREFVQQVALAAGRIDISGQLPELNAELMASSYIGAGLEGDKSPTMAQWVDFFRMPPSRAHEHSVYKELYDIHDAPIRAAEGAQIAADVRAKMPPGSTPDEENKAIEAAIQARIHRETEAQIADAQRVFNEYRREYGAAWQAEGQQPEAAAAGPK